MTNKITIPAPGAYRLLSRNVTIDEVANYMVQLIHELFYDATVRKLAERVMTTPGNVLQLIADQAENTRYSPDTKHQTIRTPAAVLRDGLANCVDYTIFVASIAHALGFPVKFKVVTLIGMEQPTHVYPVVDGVVMDMCIGREDDPFALPRIGLEVPFVHSTIYKI